MAWLRSPLLWLLLAVGAPAGYMYLSSQALPPVLVLKGSTMGTYWRVTILDNDDEQHRAGLTSAIDDILTNLSDRLSHWDAGSELSRLNRSEIRQWQQVSSPLQQVLLLSQVVAAQTEGVFDVTAGRLVNLWGFGPNPVPARPPSDSKIQRELLYQGWKKLEIQDGKARRMDHFRIDLSAIAKGYAVDAVSDLLLKFGYANHLVDIGGELKVSGYRDRDLVPWETAIARPPGAPVLLAHRQRRSGAWALATSGSYRNFRQWKDEHYPHLLDLKTGEPVQNNLASVSVLHESCALADAYATALMVMGREKALAFAEEKKLSVLLMERQQDSAADWKLYASSRWRQILRTEGLDNPDSGSAP